MAKKKVKKKVAKAKKPTAKAKAKPSAKAATKKTATRKPSMSSRTDKVGSIEVTETGVRILNTRGSQLAETSFGKFYGTMNSLLGGVTGDFIPDGVRLSYSENGNTKIIVHETEPRIVNVKWKDEHTKNKHKFVKVAMPYVVTLFAVKGNVLQTGDIWPFFRTEPLTSLDDMLSYAALHNVSVMQGRGIGDKPGVWLCTQYLRPPEGMRLDQVPWQEMMRGALQHMWETGFNRSSIENEGDDFYRRQNIPALTPVQNWVKNTEENPGFILEQKYEEAYTLREACGLVLKRHHDKKLTSVGLLNELRNAFQQ